jgi:hypothetical protein
MTSPIAPQKRALPPGGFCRSGAHPLNEMYSVILRERLVSGQIRTHVTCRACHNARQARYDLARRQRDRATPITNK